jgi:hypothetical protein
LAPSRRDLEVQLESAVREIYREIQDRKTASSQLSTTR